MPSSDTVATIVEAILTDGLFLRVLSPDKTKCIPTRGTSSSGTLQSSSVSGQAGLSVSKGFNSLAVVRFLILSPSQSFVASGFLQHMSAFGAVPAVSGVNLAAHIQTLESSTYTWSL
ncbi:hypothetical protein E4U39_005866, partial [Claviceps sp. Clav50 group G5]